MSSIPLITGMDPEDQPSSISYKRNMQWSKSGPYVTKLDPSQEAQFQQWVKSNNVNWKDSPTADYDMRGYWKSLVSSNKSQKPSVNRWDNKIHYPDTWKTPYDATFSNESMYAKPDAPRWVGNKLYDNKGNLIVDETPKTTAKYKIGKNRKSWKLGVRNEGNREFKGKLASRMKSKKTYKKERKRSR